MLKWKRARCTALCSGIITDMRCKGTDFPTIITVEYQIGTAVYTLRESLKLRSEALRIGRLPIGQRKLPKLPEAHVGGRVRVCYNPGKPAQAYLPDNLGIVNC